MAPWTHPTSGYILVITCFLKRCERKANKRENPGPFLLLFFFFNKTTATLCWQHRQAGFNKCNYVSLKVQRSSSSFFLKRNPEDLSRTNSTWRTVWEITKRKEPGRDGKADRNVVIRSDSKLDFWKRFFYVLREDGNMTSTLLCRLC